MISRLQLRSFFISLVGLAALCLWLGAASPTYASAAQLAFSTGLPSTPVAGTPYTVIAQLEDSSGNPVAQSGVSVTLSSSPADELGGSLTVSTDTNGQATLTGIRVLTVTGITITASASGYTSATDATNGVDAMDANIVLNYVALPPSVIAGTPFSVSVKATVDNYPIEGLDVDLQQNSSSNFVTATTTPNGTANEPSIQFASQGHDSLTASGDSSSQIVTSGIDVYAPLASVTLVSNSIASGQSVMGTVTIHDPAVSATNGETVYLTSSSPFVTVPGDVLVMPGQTTASFTASTTNSPAAVNATITATVATSTATASLALAASGSGVQFDFNSDGNADLLWYNTQLGGVSIWDMDDTNVLSYGLSFAQTDPSTGWQPVASPDINGDGFPDLIWWNSTTGEISAWALQNDTVISYGGDFATIADTNWKPVAAADVTGTTWELVFQNTLTGDISCWTMNGTNVTAYGPVLGSLGANSPWQIVGAPDLDDNGYSDLLFWNSSTGEVSWWSTVLASSTVNSYNGDFAQVADTSWHLVGSEDTNGDGNPDLIWWNAGTGAVSRWLLSGTTVTDYGSVEAQVDPSTGWEPAAIR